jgi:hypothetical protein
LYIHPSIRPDHYTTDSKLLFIVAKNEVFIMAATVTAFVTDTITKTVSMAATAASTARAKAQGGILEGENPTHYNPKDPIIIFIIQVFEPYDFDMLCIDSDFLGWRDHPLLSLAPLALVENPTASCHCRSHRWCLTRPLGHG